MCSNFKEQAIEYVKQAVQEDNAGNYAKAFPLYMNALEYFKTHLKYEKNPKIKEAITQKFTEYLRRALEIRAVLDDGGPGPASNGGEGAVVARPKTKPKDGEGGGDGEDPEQAKLRSGLEQRNPRRGASYYAEGQDDDFDDQLSLPSSSSSSSSASKPCIPEAEEEEDDDGGRKMYSNFKEQAIEYVKQAVQEDNAGNYAKAFPLYMNALEYFKTHLKYEKNPEIKEAITQKFTEYLRRAEEIRAVLDDGGLGPASNGGEGAVVARPKTKPKDGEGGGDGEDPEQAKLRSGLEQRNPRRGASYYAEGQDDDFDDQLSLPSSSSSSSASKPCIPEAEEEEDDDDDEEEEEQEEEEKSGDYPLKDMPSKFLLYQQSVQSPKGDISYMQKFFLMYAGGRLPLHLQEDFCGTALLSAEWIRSNPRRTAVGLDLDLEALNWCMENNINRVGADGYSRTSLFHGNVLQPLEAKLVKFEPHELISNITLEEGKDGAGNCALESAVQVDSTTEDKYMKNVLLPPRDIVCAFNYSCCCLHKRADLVLYFKHVLDALSKKGGIFVMDLYGGISSERKLRLKRRFANFTYVWEQAEFDIIERKTRISLHFDLQKQKRKLRHAFSYSWRLWSLPEIKDCLEEAGFRSVHFWLREMPDTEEFRMTEGFGAVRDVKYEEVKSFQQQDAWNAYIVGVA